MTRTEAMGVLKDPHTYSMGLLTNALKNFTGKNLLVQHCDDSNFFRVCLGGDRYIDINLNSLLLKDHGMFDMTCPDCERINNLERYLKYPLLPTEEERTLFEIEFGFEYPLKMDKAPLSLDNAQLISVDLKEIL